MPVSLYTLIAILSSVNAMKLYLQRDSSPACVQQLIGWKLLHIKNLVGRDRHRRAPIGKVVVRFLASVKRVPDNLEDAYLDTMAVADASISRASPQRYERTP